ncbi:MAG: head-tail adaptor protein [Oscillospiraceae bacterium]|jgi:head-tail adaptor|nr:head-tail adaptor protein [Oscillospiraceae bacterium]
MGIGKMTAFIDIVRTDAVRDADGFVTHTDVVLASVRAYKEERHGTERWANRAVFSTANTLFQFRTIPGLDIIPSLYIRCAGKRYRISSAEDVRGRGMYVEVLAELLEPSKQ